MVKKFHIYLANLEPSFGAEPGKSRPVVIVQTDALNDMHPTTIICPLTTNLNEVPIIRVNVPASLMSGLDKDSDIMVDQIRSIDIKRLKRHIGRLNDTQSKKLIDGVNVLINE